MRERFCDTRLLMSIAQTVKSLQLRTRKNFELNARKQALF
jgi:hypothetical protein